MLIKKVELNDLNANISGPCELFICSSSFEDRCMSIPINIDFEKINKALILSNLDYSDYVGPNQKKLNNLLRRKGEVVGIRSSDPISTADIIKSRLNDAKAYGDIRSIWIDVTTLTHETLLILLRLLNLEFPDSTVTGFYTNASEYSIGDTVKHKWLSRGAGEIRSVLGYPGNIIPSRRTHLIVLVGYEHERASGLIEAIEPNSIALGYGRSGSATTDKDKEANEHYMYLVNQMLTSFPYISRFEIPCNNPYGAYVEIQRQISNIKDMNILVAPMNNKLSTIGAAWAAIANENVQLCYAQALSYNYSNYSSPGSHCYIFDLQWKGRRIEDAEASGNIQVC